MTTKRKVGIGVGVVAGLAVLVGVILYIRSLGKPPQATASPSPSPTLKVRALGNEKFGPRARAQSTANVDIGIQTVLTPGSSPAPSARPAATSGDSLAGLIPVALAQSQSSPVASPVPSTQPNQPGRQPSPSAGPSARPTALPLPSPPTFQALPAAPAPQIRELVTVYSKGDSGKRQIYLRSLDRDKDEPLVSSVFDDFGVSFATATQKVAFYSNEEGPSDASRSRSKLKVVDIATKRVQTIASGLPGAWPATWSSDGKRLAIPTNNSIFLADTTTGTSLQIPTGRSPGAISWAPGNLKIYFQAEANAGNFDIFEADAITAQARGVINGPRNERFPAVDAGGGRLSYVRDQAEERSGTAVVVRDLVSNQDRPLDKAQPVDSYLFNLDLTDLVFVKTAGQPKVNRLKREEIKEVGDLANPTLVAWDRDYDHVFVLADDDQGKALFTLELSTGQAQKVKAGVSDSVPSSAR